MSEAQPVRAAGRRRSGIARQPSVHVQLLLARKVGLWLLLERSVTPGPAEVVGHALMLPGTSGRVIYVHAHVAHRVGGRWAALSYEWKPQLPDLASWPVASGTSRHSASLGCTVAPPWSAACIREYLGTRLEPSEPQRVADNNDGAGRHRRRRQHRVQEPELAEYRPQHTRHVPVREEEI